MVWMEWFKKHKNRLFIGLGIFLGCLLVIAFMIASPGLFVGLIAGLSLTGCIVLTVLWLGLNGLMDNIGKWVQQIKDALATPLTAEDGVTPWVHDPSVPLDYSNHPATSHIEDHDHQSSTRLFSKDECVECSHFQEAKNLDKLNVNTPNQENIGIDKSTTKNQSQFRIAADIHLGFFSSRVVDEQSNPTRSGSCFNLNLRMLINAKANVNSNQKIIQKL